MTMFALLQLDYDDVAAEVLAVGQDVEMLKLVGSRAAFSSTWDGEGDVPDLPWVALDNGTDWRFEDDQEQLTISQVEEV